LGIERLSGNRDHPLCLSQGRSTRSCSGAPQKHPSPADARSKLEGVALPPIDVFTRRAERRGSTPSPGPAAPPNFFVWSRRSSRVVPVVIRKRTWVVAAAPLLVGAAYLAAVWTIDRNELHAPGTYYFENFTGHSLPWRPVREISRDEALSRDVYVVGVYNDDGRLVVIERYWGGSLFFRNEYGYDAEGELSEERSWQEGEAARTRRFDRSS